MSEFDRVVAALPDLTREQLLEVRARATALLGAGASATVGVVGGDPGRPDVDLVHQHFAAILHSRTGRVVPPPPVLKRTWRLWSAYEQGCLGVAEYVRTRLQAKPGAETHKALHLCIEEVARWLEQRSIPVTQRNLAINLKEVGAVMDDAFPGYGEAGLLPAVVRASSV